MSVLSRPHVTPEEYLEQERKAPYKSQYYKGQIYAMVGATSSHSLITGNLIRVIGNQLKGRPCVVHTSDMRINVSATGLYTYPDVSALCGEPRFLDDRQDTLLNPTVIFEVLSRSTELYDRGKKFEHYRSIPSLREYVLLSQARPRIEVFSRKTDGSWGLSEATGLDSQIEIGSISCILHLAEVYDKVELRPEEEAEVPTSR